MRARRVRGAAALVGLLLATVACGVPMDSSPRTISRGNIPVELLSPAPAITTSTTARASLTEVIEVYLVGEDRLFPVPRTVPAPASPPQALGALLAGATADERTNAGLRTAIGRRSNLVVVAVAGRFARVELDDAVVRAQGREQLLALAQIVYTLASLPDVDGVEFSVRGALVEVPTGDGTLKSGPVMTSDYAALGPR
jgi:spore germination protein GerM